MLKVEEFDANVKDDPEKDPDNKYKFITFEKK